MKVTSNMKKVGMALTLAILTASILAQSAEAADTQDGQQDAPSTWSDSAYRDSQAGPFPEHRLQDGTVTGPIARSANGG